MSPTIPAMPVRDMLNAVEFYREVEVTGVDDVSTEMLEADGLHPVSKDGVDDTDVGTREFATLDQDGSLVTFFRRVAS